jgi:hypothetical protein
MNERRKVQRYAMHLTAEVRPTQEEGAAAAGYAVRIRDISSLGVSFYHDGLWRHGEAVSLGIGFGQEIAQPYSYRFKVDGTIVRRGWDAPVGRGYCAVSFTKPGVISDWRDALNEGGRQ